MRENYNREGTTRAPEPPPPNSHLSIISFNSIAVLRNRIENLINRFFEIFAETCAFSFASLTFMIAN